jgi:TPR repeat protein
VGKLRAPVKGPETYMAVAATAWPELQRLWTVAAHAATFAVSAAAAAASAKTLAAARAKVNGVAQTAARAAVVEEIAALAGSHACLEGLIVAALAVATEEVERARQPTAAGATGSGGKASTAVPATETAPPPSTSSAQTSATREGRTGTASAASVSQEAAAAAPTHASDRAALVSRLCTFATSTAMVMYTDMKAWFASEFSGDWAAIAAAAEGGDTKAQLVMGRAPHISEEERVVWWQRAIDQGHLDAHPYPAMSLVGSSEAGGVSSLGSAKDDVMDFLKLPLESGSAPAQYIKGMLLYIFDCGSGAEEDFVDTTRWIRRAAKQELPDAQYELGEMFRRGPFCDHVENMCFARKHLRRAARQGHADAVERLREIRSCAYCGIDDAPWKCGFCHLGMYCDYATCCVKHWREGGGVGGGIIVDAGARHRKVCPRTQAAPDDESEEEEEEREVEEGEEED